MSYACHCLPGKGRNRPIIVKFMYNHQRDAVWNKRFDFWDDLTGNKNHVNERLAEKDREIMIYCRRDKIYYHLLIRIKSRLKSTIHMADGNQLITRRMSIFIWEMRSQ